MKKILMLAMVIGSMAFGAAFEKPAVLTSAGQSADVNMVKALLKKVGVEAEMDKAITADKLGSAKTLVVAIGGSSKGLGAAGIKPEAEIDRVEKLIAGAKASGVKVLGLHVGGEARRGDLSDRFINSAAPLCDALIVVEDGNKDGLFTNISKDKNIPIDFVGKITEAAGPLQKAFE